MKIYEKHNYLNKELEYIRSGTIIEYDMRNAGVEILYGNKIFNKDNYDTLMKLDKLDRSIVVGKYLKEHPKVNDFLIKSFVKIRQELFEKNNIQDDDVLSIKKDAIFLIDREIYNLKLDKGFEFIKKNEYQVYINLFNKEFYYNLYENRLDIKGFGKKIKEHHENFLFKELKEVLKSSYYNDIDGTFLKLINFKDDFVNRTLRKEYYYDIGEGDYLINLLNNMYKLEDIDETLKKEIFINNNLQFIIEMCNKVL